MMLKTKILTNFTDVEVTTLITKLPATHMELEITTSNPEELIPLLQFLKTVPEIHCEQLIDLCAVDYLYYGQGEWNTQTATKTGFSRATSTIKSTRSAVNQAAIKARFAVVYHLLSLSNNLRVRVKCWLIDQNLTIPSITVIWQVANWYEREAFDLFGINFLGHPNLVKILTEDNLVGHPLRKDFPLMGNSEVRFDGQQQKIIHEPITTTDYPVVPKVIRPINIGNVE